MAREILNKGTIANDGTGDTLRAATDKINNNFVELYDQAEVSLPFGLNSITYTSNATINLDYSFIICNKSTALSLSLPDGTAVGQFKIFTNKGVGYATITPVSFAHASGSYFRLDQYEGCTVIWDGTNWYLVGNQSQLTIA